MNAEAARAAPFRDAELAFEPADFQRVRSLIHARVGIDLHPGKQTMVYGRLQRRLRESGHTSFRSYLDALQRSGESEWQEFVNCLTTNLTSFFRESHHFDALAQELRERAGGVRRIWSCACSTGEEPYSIAMTCTETLGAQHRIAIEGSDVDTQVLAQAREAIYAADAATALGATRLRRFFQRGTGANEGRARVIQELRSQVSFRPFNLLGERWEAGNWDVVFCRNVMIYFDRPTQRRVLERLHGCMVPGGLLFVGHSENFADHRDLFTLCGKTAYRRVG